MNKKTIFVIFVCTILFASAAYAGIFENKKISGALEGNALKVGMTKDELVAAIGYPPEGKPKQDSMFYRFAQSKVTAAGKEESWTYQIAPSPDGVRSVTFKMVDGRVTEWTEWRDSKK